MPMPYKFQTSKEHWVGVSEDRTNSDFVLLTVAVENWGEKTIRVDKRALPELVELFQTVAMQCRR
ncbi:hypothetical protein ACW9HW_02005 [Pseudomonas sp. SDO5532_S415]|jgi:hypothetical protein|uniref:hypothetical protein n=1 Tax=Pseudomonas sp. Irchel 3A7 TaxID=2008913 RepID=UPI000BA49051|nr:hypothetical protein [Pseudomonas sp. Irchel 3A7]